MPSWQGSTTRRQDRQLRSHIEYCDVDRNPAPLTIQANNAICTGRWAVPNLHRDDYRFEEHRRNHGVLQHNGNATSPAGTYPITPSRGPQIP